MRDPDVVAVALSQSRTRGPDVADDVAAHVAVLETAAARGARVVVFPELSLTGYELDRIASDPALPLTPDDARLEPLRRAASAHRVTALVGAPVRIDGRLVLGCLVVAPDEPTRVYAKRNLFEREREVFAAGDAPLVVDVDGVRLAVGVCADLADDAQVEELVALDADAWLLGVLVTPGGYAADADRAERAARRSGVPVLLSSHGGPTGGWESAGGSGVWEPDGTGARAGRPGPTGDDDLLVVEVRRGAR